MRKLQRPWRVERITLLGVRIFVCAQRWCPIRARCRIATRLAAELAKKRHFGFSSRGKIVVGTSGLRPWLCRRLNYHYDRKKRTFAVSHYILKRTRCGLQKPHDVKQREAALACKNGFWCKSNIKYWEHIKLYIDFSDGLDFPEGRPVPYVQVAAGGAARWKLNPMA